MTDLEKVKSLVEFDQRLRAESFRKIVVFSLFGVIAVAETVSRQSWNMLGFSLIMIFSLIVDHLSIARTRKLIELLVDVADAPLEISRTS